MTERVRVLAALALLVVAAAGCSGGATSSGRTPLDPPAGPLNRIAILRLERADLSSETEVQPASDNPNPRLSPDAETAVTAQIYGVLANDPRWRLVPDLEVDDVMREVPIGGTLESRAQVLGKATKADAVVCGHVSRFQERLGSEYGARYPASVSFDLELVEVSTGHVLWRGSFDQTQRDLSSNLLDFWMFWQAGPHWFSAAELAHLGVEKLIEDLDEAVEQ